MSKHRRVSLTLDTSPFGGRVLEERGQLMSKNTHKFGHVQFSKHGTLFALSYEHRNTSESGAELFARNRLVNLLGKKGCRVSAMFLVIDGKAV